MPKGTKRKHNEVVESPVVGELVNKCKTIGNESKGTAATMQHSNSRLQEFRKGLLKLRGRSILCI